MRTLSALVLAACGSGTDLNQIVDVNPISDAGVSSAEGGGTTFMDPFAGAPGYTAGMGQDSHNAGKDCLQSGCHGSGGNAPHFLAGGTIYADYKGTTPAAGVEIRIIDSAGHAASTYSASSGNFYIPAAGGNGAGVGFPAVVGARDGMSSRPMITTLTTASMGGCAQTKCHVPGGGPQSGTGSYYPIHVP